MGAGQKGGQIGFNGEAVEYALRTSPGFSVPPGEIAPRRLVTIPTISNCARQHKDSATDPTLINAQGCSFLGSTAPKDKNVQQHHTNP